VCYNICRLLNYIHVHVLENVPPLGDSQPVVLATWQQIRAWIGEPMQVDVVVVDSHAHCFWWLWTNLASPKVFWSAYRFILRSPTCLVDDILDP
jgi:hypothetical protein